MYKLVFFVPETHCEHVKQAVFEAGAGKQGHYSHCSWQTLGQGQFLPLQDSQPYLGEKDTLEVVAEYRVEVLCDDDVLRQVVRALRQSHPYEEPAYDVLKLESF
ncbi:MAG: NGG1p interacting factor NIF3 [Cellvibrionaceae bacterium]